MKWIGLMVCWLVLGSFSPLQAQDSEHPVKWSFSIEKKGANQYTLLARADLAPGFHIWALDPGGDGSLIATAFTLNEEQAVRWDGGWKQKQQPVTHSLEFIEGPIHWFENTVTFYRDFTAEVAIPISGAVTFQVCNGQSCFPPETKDFQLQVTP